MYTKKIETTDTNFTLASYRYSTSGYYSFADANEKYDDSDTDWSFRYNKRSRLQLNLNQTILNSSLYVSGYQQDYWQTSRKERSVTSGFSRVIGGLALILPIPIAKPAMRRATK